jgi:hypothetical protein
MRKYRATLAMNERTYRDHEFEAPDDEAAKAFCEAALQAYRNPTRDKPGVEWEEFHTLEDADCDDPNIMLDRWETPPPNGDERLRTVDGTWETIEDEILDPGHLYYSQAKAFISKIANMDDCRMIVIGGDALANIVEEARALLHGERNQASRQTSGLESAAVEAAMQGGA